MQAQEASGRSMRTPVRRAVDNPGGGVEGEPASGPRAHGPVQNEGEISNLRSKKESIVSRLKVLLEFRNRSHQSA